MIWVLFGLGISLAALAAYLGILGELAKTSLFHVGSIGITEHQTRKLVNTPERFLITCIVMCRVHLSGPHPIQPIVQ